MSLFMNGSHVLSMKFPVPQTEMVPGHVLLYSPGHFLPLIKPLAANQKKNCHYMSIGLLKEIELMALFAVIRLLKQK